MEERAVKICKQLYAALNNKPCEGAVSYVDEAEIDIDSPIGIVRFFSQGLLRPYSCLVPVTMNFEALSLTIGMKVFLDSNEIDIEGTDTLISLKMAEQVDLAVNSVGMFLPIDLKQRLPYLERAVELNNEKGEICNDISQDDPYSLRKKLSALSKAVQEESYDDVLAAAKECAGFGSSRFPASDSLLCGYMLALSAYSYSMERNMEHVKRINQAILEGAAANTSRESGFLLWLASNGLADEDGCLFFRALFSDKPYQSLLASASAAIAQNGCDWMAGICLFIRYFAY